MKKIVNLVLMLTILFSGVLFAVSTVSAQALETKDLIDTDVIDQTGLKQADLPSVIAQIIRTVMGLLGIVAVVIILIGGFYWMTAGGDEGRVETGKKWIFSGIIGLAIILSAYALATFVINSLTDAIDVSEPVAIGYVLNV